MKNFYKYKLLYDLSRNFNFIFTKRSKNRRTDKILNEKLLKRLPKKYHDRFRKIVVENDLIDNCKYLVFYTDEYTDGECNGSCFPVKSITEAIYYLKNNLYKEV